jgi:hypothetical protein
MNEPTPTRALPARSWNPVIDPAAAPLHDSPTVPRDITSPDVAMQNRPTVATPSGPMKFAPEAVIPERAPAVAENPIVTDHRDSHQIPKAR